MSVIAIINLKGGVGKTMTAMALATAASRSGVDVEVLDCDPQASASLWADLAEEGGEGLPFEVGSANLATMRRLKERPGLHIVDCPPTGNVVDEAMRAADLVIVPANASSADIQKTWDVVDTLEAIGKAYRVLLTRVNPATLAYRSTVSALRDGSVSRFEAEIPQREALKNYYGHEMGEALYGYERVWDEITESEAI